MEFFDSVKKWFYTNNSQAASATARIPLLDASGNPIGSDTMANIAPFLGKYFKLSSVLSAGQYWDTGLSVGSFGGDTILGLFNGNTGSGDATVIHVFAIRRGYDNNANGGLYDIVFNRKDIKVTMSKSSNNTIVLRAPAGNSTIFLIGAKL